MNEEFRESAPHSPEPDWDAISRVIAGESDPDEVVSVSAWLIANPVDARLIEIVKLHADTAERSAQLDVDVEAALGKVRARMLQEEGVAGSPTLKVSHGGGAGANRSRSPWWSSRAGRIGLAAAAVAVIAVSVRSWQNGLPSQSAPQVLATAVGQRDSLMLSDGTRVVLAPGSQITVAAGFDGGDRLVELEGAAYFDVHHDESRLFTVRAAGAVIRDIGTAFTVKTDDVGGVTVAVTHGIVAVGSTTADATASVELRAGDRGRVNAGNVAVTRGIVLPADADWTQGQLSYRDTPLSEVQADLKRWYGITLLINDSTLTRLTVTMPSQPESASLLRTLATLLGAQVEQRGDTVILRSAGTGTTP